MGCGSSVPDVIIPDPVEGQNNTFLCKSAGVFSGGNYEVFKDFDEDKKWLLIRREGSFWKGTSTYTVENFVRVEDSKKGVPLAIAEMQPLQVRFYDWWGRGLDSDMSDGYSPDEIGWDVEREYVQIQRTKWVAICLVVIRSAQTNVGTLTLRVKAKGHAKRKEIRELRRDPNTNQESWHTRTEHFKKLKRFCYRLNDANGVPIPLAMTGWINAPSTNTWESNLFHCETSGFFSQKAKITTGVGLPALNLLIAFLCSIEMSPSDIVNQIQW